MYRSVVATSEPELRDAAIHAYVQYGGSPHFRAPTVSVCSLLVSTSNRVLT